MCTPITLDSKLKFRKLALYGSLDSTQASRVVEKTTMVQTLLLIAAITTTLLMQGCVQLIYRPTVTHEFDNFVVMKTTRDLLKSSNVGRKAISRAFYQRYDDEFDLIVLVYNVPSELESEGNWNAAGLMKVVRNSVGGDGVRNRNIGKSYGSPSKLKGIISLFCNDFIMRGPLLHEIMHLWMSDIEVIPTSIRSHWGFSSVNGQLGGFDRSGLVKHGNGLYSVGSTFDVHGNVPARPYAPLELYLAGWLASDEVPEILVAENATFWIEEEDGNRVSYQFASQPRFAATGLTTWNIDQIIDKIGKRVPGIDESQKSFRMATIVIESEEFPLTPEVVNVVSTHIELFTRAESVKNLKQSSGFYNFWDATMGLASMNANLRSARRSTKH